MGRHRGPTVRLARRFGMNLFLKEHRARLEKSIQRRDYPPGMQGQNRRIKISDYGHQLREKQKVKLIYGVYERQFRRYFREASRHPGATGQELMRILERRLDNAVYRTGFAQTRAQARQMVSHGAVWVNGRKVTIPSFQVAEMDEFKLKVKPDRAKRIQEIYKNSKESFSTKWLEINDKALSAKVTRLPERSDVDFPLEEQLIVELYSK